MAETFLYLTTTGRTSGNPHKIEIWFVEHDGCYYLCSGERNKADWVKNIRQNTAVTYYLATQDDPIPDPQPSGIAQALDDDSETRQQVKALFEKKYNWSNGLLVQICPDA